MNEYEYIKKWVDEEKKLIKKKMSVEKCMYRFAWLCRGLCSARPMLADNATNNVPLEGFIKKK